MTTRQLFFGAAFIYLAISPWFFHPDLKVIFSLASRLSQGVINIYPVESTAGPFVYPPLAYFVLGTLYLPVRFLAGSDFSAWLFSGNTNVSDPHIFRYILLLKLPFILLHLLVGKWLFELSKSRTVLLVWLFNPIALYVVGLQGQIDLLAVACSVLCLRYYKTRPGLSVVLLGLGAAIKTYPLLLLPFLLLYISPSWFQRLKYGLIGLASYAIWVVPFLTTPAFFTATLTSGLSQRLFEVHLPFLPISIPAVPLVLICLWLWLVVTKSKPALAHIFLAITLVILAAVKIHPQWLLWCLPFLCLTFSPKHWYLYAAFFVLALLTIFLIPDNFLSVSLVAPLVPAVYELPIISSLLPSILQVTPILFSLTCLGLAYQSLHD